jgi:beta-ribofuranosylaminobenzene 5'-phosphate synthase
MIHVMVGRRRGVIWYSGGMAERVEVRAGCRLHFGMFGFGEAAGAEFGGVGVMVSPPAVEVVLERFGGFVARGALAGRVEGFARRAALRWGLAGLPACEVRVASPPDHVGLGVGTQLALAVAAGLRRWLELPAMGAEELAASVGRGGRSAVGTHGFQQGGLIVDGGKRAGAGLGQLVRRVAVPEAWRLVLVRVGEERGLAGETEQAAFARLPAVPRDVTDELWRITNEQIVPAVERGDCGGFGEAVYRFGRLAGECFAAVQGGPFASERIAHLVETLREYGVRGVGQSSWGPTVFAITASEEEAQALAGWVASREEARGSAITIARPNNCGAQVSVR